MKENRSGIRQNHANNRLRTAFRIIAMLFLLWAVLIPAYTQTNQVPLTRTAVYDVEQRREDITYSEANIKKRSLDEPDKTGSLGPALTTELPTEPQRIHYPPSETPTTSTASVAHGDTKYTGSDVGSVGQEQHDNEPDVTDTNYRAYDNGSDVSYNNNATNGIASDVSHINYVAYGNGSDTSDNGDETYYSYNETQRNNTDYYDNDYDCHPTFIMALEGAVAWSSVQNCRVLAVWMLLPPPDHAVTIKIEKIIVRSDYLLEIWAYVKSDNQTHPSLIRRYNKGTYDSGFPLLIDGNVVELRVTPADFGSCTFHVIYYAHPTDSIPAVVEYDFNEEEITDSSVKFDCANITKIPEVLLCDLVRQCVGGEDEVRCPYQEDGACGDWVPYGDKCLKLEFVRQPILIAGLSTPTMPLQAMEQCRTKYGATLARLPDDKGVTLLAGMIGNAGYKSATIGPKKVKPVSPGLRHLYRFIWQWGDKGDPVAHEQMEIQRSGSLYDCAMLSVVQETEIVPIACSLPRTIPDGYTCMRQRSSPTQPHASVAALEKTSVSEPLNYAFPRTNAAVDLFPTKHCRDGSRVQTFHRCSWDEFELETERFAENFGTKSASLNSKPDIHRRTESNLPLFQCQFGQSIHYTLVCDGHDDCPDKSDELFCQNPRLPPLHVASFACRGSQIIPASLRCDGNPDCFDESDEEDCSKCSGKVLCAGLGCLQLYYAQFIPSSCPFVTLSYTPITNVLPASLNMDGTGMSTFVPTAMCSLGEFECSNGLCIPAFLVNNGEQDCPHGEDEHIPKENVTCPGYYRCHSVGLCVPAEYVCDGVYHCPNKDDERFCDLSCPTNCSCEGHAYTCTAMFDPVHHLHVRYLDLSGATDPTLSNISVMEYMHFLNLSSCQLKNVALSDLPHLIILDISVNALEGISSFFLEKLSRLNWLDLSGNPLVNTLDASFTSLLTLAEASELHTLIITNTHLTSISNGVFAPLSELRTLDLRGNGLTDFDDGVFSGLRALAKVYADNYKLCCPYFHPSPIDCLAPQDELSSCSDLLRVDFFRVFLWAFSLLAIAGNGGSLAYRLCCQKLRGLQQCSRILVANLCLADLLMGVYMMMLGTADAHYRGVYVSREGEWRGSVVCKIAGFLAFVSCEVSAFAICLVTLDRFLVLCFPLKSNLHMTSCSALVACGASWVVGVVLASVPLVAKWEFYGQNGVCLPLPITRQEYQGQDFAFAVFIVLNFVFFLVIGAGQVVIFQSVRSTGSKLGSERSKREVTVAKRLFLIVLSDFLCWFPIGLMGLLASQGTPVPGEVNIWAAIFVVPFNAALNPFLYTINSLRERWARREEEKRMKKTIGQLHSSIPKWSSTAVEELTRICIGSKLVRPDLVLQWLGRDQGTGITNKNVKLESFHMDCEDLRDDPLSTDLVNFESSTCFTDSEAETLRQV